MTVSISTQKNPRTGNPMTVVSGINHNPQVIERLAKKLKSSCGAGGHVEGKTITIQGDHQDKVESILENEGYTIK